MERNELERIINMVNNTTLSIPQRRNILIRKLPLLDIEDSLKINIITKLNELETD